MDMHNTHTVRFHIANLKSDRGVKIDMSAVKETHGIDAEIVQSLAKLKRIWLKRYEVPVGGGLFCASTSIRKGYFADVTHSVRGPNIYFTV
jgi:aspartate--ammonia ligase